MDPVEKMSWSNYSKNCGPQQLGNSSPESVEKAKNEDKTVDVLALAPKGEEKPQQQDQSPQQRQFWWIDALPEVKYREVCDQQRRERERERDKKSLPKPESNDPRPNLGRPFVALKEETNSDSNPFASNFGLPYLAPKPTSLSNASYPSSARSQLEPSTMAKSRAKRAPRPRKKAKKETEIVDLTMSDNDEGTASCAAPLKKDQAESNKHSNMELDASSTDDANKGLPTQQASNEGHEKASSSNTTELSEAEIAQRLQKYIIRMQDREAAELKEANERRDTTEPQEQNKELATEDTATYQVAETVDDDEEYEEEPWTVDEDEELARWKLGGFTEEQFDWPTFHESRTWKALNARLVWLETRNPALWAILKKIEDEDQELFERELSVEIAEMEARDWRPKTPDKKAADETKEDEEEVSSSDSSEGL